MKELFWEASVNILDEEGNAISFESLDNEDAAKIADAIRRGFECGKIKVDY